jgi:hypothetical protein
LGMVEEAVSADDENTRTCGRSPARRGGGPSER